MKSPLKILGLSVVITFQSAVGKDATTSPTHEMASFSVTVPARKANGENWDALGGKPDPKICTLSAVPCKGCPEPFGWGEQQCTKIFQDTFTVTTEFWRPLYQPIKVFIMDMDVTGKEHITTLFCDGGKGQQQKMTYPACTLIEGLRVNTTWTSTEFDL